MAPLKLKKQVKKKFFPVNISTLDKEIELFASSIEDLDGRFVKLDMTSQLKGKALELKFTINVEDGKPITKVVQGKLLSYYTKRAARKGTDYCEDSFIVQCKDHRIRLKPFLVTRKRVHRRVLKGLREAAREFLEEYVKTKTFENIVLDLMSGKLQKEMSGKLKKIYPLSLCDVRFLAIEELKEHELYEQQQKESKEAPAKEKEEPKTAKKKTVKKAAETKSEEKEESND